METAIEIRVGEASDAAMITEFNAAMALESEAVALDKEALTAGVQAALGDWSKAFYLLAEVGGHPAGQLMVTYEWSDWRNGWVWWVQSVYVKPEFRRQGIYRRLYRRVEELAEERGDVRGIRLYVMRENTGAKRTYESLGMHHSEYDLYETDF